MSDATAGRVHEDWATVFSKRMPWAASASIAGVSAAA
jgi:hypothetical protein